MFKQAYLSLFVFSLLFPSISFAADPKIEHKQISVAATNDEWTPTSIKVAVGDVLIVNELGSKVKVGAWLGEVGADGASTGEGALHLKIGVGAGQKVGAHGYVMVTQAGAVKLKVNDSQYADNLGEFTVNLIRIPAALIPTPQVVAPQ